MHGDAGPPAGFYVLAPTDEMCIRFDSHFKPWNVAADGRQIAADLVNADGQDVAGGAPAARYAWDIRRMNRAVLFLMSQAIAQGFEALGLYYPVN